MDRLQCKHCSKEVHPGREITNSSGLKTWSAHDEPTLVGTDIPVTVGNVVERDEFRFADLRPAVTTCGVHPG